MLSLIAVPQELITTMSRAQHLYLQEQTDARYIHITHHLKKKKCAREKSGSQMASSHLPPTTFAQSHWTLPQPQVLPVHSLPKWQQS